MLHTHCQIPKQQEQTFVIKKKKSNKWRLLTDLRKVSASVKPMGALQPGQDCFFNIPLHPLDE